MLISLSTKVDPNSVESTCKIGRVLYNQETGMGETPNSRNVIYKGFAVLMRASKFLELAAPGERTEDANAIADRIVNGEAIASPFLELRMTEFMEAVDDEEIIIPYPSVEGHEGRGRVTAILKIQPNLPILVHVFIGHYRARSLSPIIFDLLQRGIHQEKTGRLITHPFDTIFWNGKVVEQ